MRGMKIILSSVFTILASLIFGSQVVFAVDDITISLSPNGINMTQNAASDHVAIRNNTCIDNAGNGINVQASTSGLCISENYTNGNAAGLVFTAVTLTDAVAKNNYAIDGVTSSATFNGNTSYIDTL